MAAWSTRLPTGFGRSIQIHPSIPAPSVLIQPCRIVDQPTVCLTPSTHGSAHVYARGHWSSIKPRLWSGTSFCTFFSKKKKKSKFPPDGTQCTLFPSIHSPSPLLTQLIVRQTSPMPSPPFEDTTSRVLRPISSGPGGTILWKPE